MGISRSLLRTAFIVSAILITVTTASLFACGVVLQHEASNLLTDVKSLGIGTTSSEDAKRFTDRHRKELSKVDCEHESCDYSFIVSNRLLSWTHLEPAAHFVAGFTVADGTVIHIYAALFRSMPIFPTFFASAGMVDEYAEVPKELSRGGHYEFPTPFGKPYLRVRLDRHADVVQREHAFAFSFRCLTKPGGECDLPCDYLPDAWQDWQTDLARNGFTKSDF